MRGIHPRSSRMRIKRSTFWATSPLRKLVDNDIWSHSSVNAIVEPSLPFHIVLFLAMSMRFINPFVSHMPMDCLFDWAATLVWSNGAIYVTGRSLIHMSVEQCFLRRLCEVNVGDSGHQSLSREALPFQMLPVEYWTYLSMFFFRSNRTASCSVCFLISGLFWKFGDAAPPSLFLSPAKRALYLLSYIFVEETVNAIIERSFRLHIVLVLAMSMRVINPFVSHMPKHCPFDWAATLVLSNGAICAKGKSLIHMSVEQCFLRRLFEVNIGDSGHQSLSQQALLFQMLPFEY